MYVCKMLHMLILNDIYIHTQDKQTHAINCVAWSVNPLYSQWVASAPTNGKVVLWNVTGEGARRRENIMEDHKRSVSRLCWHPEDPHLYTASVDGDVRLWDVNVKNHSSLLFHNTNVCRDVQVNPHRHHQVHRAVCVCSVCHGMHGAV